MLVTLLFLFAALLGLFLLSLWLWAQVTYGPLIRVASELPTISSTPKIFYHSFFESFSNKVLNWVSKHVENGVYTFCYWMGPVPFIVLTYPEDIEKVLNSSITFEKGHMYKYLARGLLNAPGDVWKTSRRQLNPLFRIQNLEKMMPLFNRNSEELASVLSEYDGLGPVNLMHYTMETALKTVCNLIYGSDVPINIKSEEFIALKESVEWLPELMCSRIFKIWLWIDASFNYLYSKDLEKLKQKRQLFTDKKIAAMCRIPNMTDAPDVKPANLFDMQKMFPLLTDRELKSVIGTLYATGTDTVGLAVATTTLVMAYHQDLQERLYEEILSVVGVNGDVTISDIKRMSYLDQVYKETLRWSTIVPFISRRTTSDMNLNDVTVPAGHTVMICLAGLHMNPKLYPEPKKFNPEHFAASGSDQKEKYSFLPFSGGPRNCIGKMYSELFIKTQIVHVLRRFKLSTKMDIYNLKRKMMVTLTCTEGYHVSLQERNRNSKNVHSPQTNILYNKSGKLEIERIIE